MTFTVNNFYIASCSDLYSVPHGAKKYHSSLSPMGNVFFFCFPKLQAELGTDTCHSNLLRILFFCLLEVFFLSSGDSNLDIPVYAIIHLTLKKYKFEILKVYFQVIKPLGWCMGRCTDVIER